MCCRRYRPLLEKEGTLLPGSPTPASHETQLKQYVQTVSTVPSQSDSSRRPSHQGSRASSGHGNQSKPGSARNAASRPTSRHSNKPPTSAKHQPASRPVSSHSNAEAPNSARTASRLSNKSDLNNVQLDAAINDSTRASSRLSNKSHHSNHSSANNDNKDE